MKIIIATSTFPAHDKDKVPAFVKDQAIELKKAHKELEIIIFTPHNGYVKTWEIDSYNSQFKEVRFSYFWPKKWQLLTGKAIMPALKQNKLFYFQIPFLFIFQYFALKKLVKKEKPDLIYAHWFTPQAINASLVSRTTKTKFMFTTHASDVSILKKIPLGLGKKIVRKVCSGAEAYTAVSDRTAGKLQDFFNKEDWKNNFKNKLSIIPMGIKTNLPKVSSSEVNKIIKEYSIPKNKEYLLFIGRLAEKKGVEYLLNAFAKVDKQKNNNLHLIIAGDGQLYDSLQKQADRLGISNVTFTGYITGLNKDALFTIADYACFPSIIAGSGDSEGFPVAIMEALAAGKIVLSSDTTGAEDIIKTGKSGYIFNQKSSDAIYEAIISAQNLSKKSKSSMRLKARGLAKQFDWKIITKRHYKIIEEALS